MYYVNKKALFLLDNWLHLFMTRFCEKVQFVHFQRCWCCSEFVQDWRILVNLIFNFSCQSSCSVVLLEDWINQCLLWFFVLPFLFHLLIPVCRVPAAPWPDLFISGKNEEEFDIRDHSSEPAGIAFYVSFFFISSSELQYFIKKEKYL